jgi:hypothetical protein
MKRRSMITLFCCSLILPAFSQNENRMDKADSYRSKQNPYYWKNRKPFESYWQQDVYYMIKANVDDKTNIVDGNEELTYYNNSPDELDFVYFHLYSNAQVKGSYLSDLYKNNNYKLHYGKYQEQGLGTNISSISADGRELKTELDNTILKVYLSEPLKPNHQITFKINFKTYFDNGTIRNRMKLFNAFGYKHYDLVHWYPRISVYDRKFGWDTEQHMDHEFYGDFGVYEVELTFPNNYIVEGTGTIQNQEEVLPESLRNKLDIRNFKNKPWGEKPSEVIKPDGSTKTWKFYAENVHDFASTADPTYRIGEEEWRGIKCISLVQEPHARRWQNAASYTAKVIQVYSEDFGMYIYPKMVVADAQDGMEYPMLTLDGGGDPDYRDLLAHEIGHNWFFGMLGTNETYRAAMDEGFTQFIENWAYEKIDGKKRISFPSESKYISSFIQPDFVRNSEVYNGYMSDAAKSSETTLNTHSDGFNGAIRHAGGYGQVYYKTATMLYNLQYVLGDSLFLSAMQHYVSQWKICHPYMEDFRTSVINYTHVDLNWFFDEWFETAKTIDYKIKSVKRGNIPGQYTITFERIGRMQMPIDFSVFADSIEYKYYIPNNWFVKETKATVLPRWIGWDKVKSTYEAHITVPGKITNVLIDPTQRLADVDMLNNSLNFPVKVSFDSKLYNPPDWTDYDLFYRPDIWYNGYDGIKVGWNLSGNYLNYLHIFDASIWYNTGVLQSNLPNNAIVSKHESLNYRFSYRTATDKFMKGSSIHLSAKLLDGLQSYIAGFDRKDISGRTKIYMYFKSMYRADSNALNYLLLPNEWGVGKLNNTLNIGLDHNYPYQYGTGNVNLNLKSSTVGSAYDYNALTLTAINRTRILKKLNLNTRFFIQYGTGSNWASESSLFLAGANPEEMMDDKFTRSQGFIPPSAADIGSTTNNFQYGGGLDLRGYAGYLAPETDARGNVVMSYKGSSGAALNTELEFNDLIRIHPRWFRNWLKVSTYLFADAGSINIDPAPNYLEMANIRVDAGLGAAFTIKKFGPLQTVNPFTIRFDMPFFLNRTPAAQPDYFAFRWLIGISRAF